MFLRLVRMDRSLLSNLLAHFFRSRRSFRLIRSVLIVQLFLYRLLIRSDLMSLLIRSVHFVLSLQSFRLIRSVLTVP